MSNTDFAPPVIGHAPKKSSCGCWIAGCLSVIAITAIGLAVAGWFAVRFYQAQVNQYTAPAPRELPKVEITEERIAEVIERTEQFQENLDKGEGGEAMVLTSEDINLLLNSKEDVSDKVFVKIENGQLVVELSIPADAIPGAQGRYFNGRITGTVSLENGELVVYLTDAEVNDAKLPDALLEQIKKENLAKDVMNDPEIRKMISKFERIEIEGDKLILIPAKTPASETASEAEETDEPESEAQLNRNSFDSGSSADTSGAEVGSEEAIVP